MNVRSAVLRILAPSSFAFNKEGLCSGVSPERIPSPEKRLLPSLSSVLPSHTTTHTRASLSPFSLPQAPRRTLPFHAVVASSSVCLSVGGVRIGSECGVRASDPTLAPVLLPLLPPGCIPRPAVHSSPAAAEQDRFLRRPRLPLPPRPSTTTSRCSNTSSSPRHSR